MLELLAIEDIPPPNFKVSEPKFVSLQNSINKPLIACIDDSLQICKIMEQIVTRAGYRFVGIQQSLEAIPSLITANPDLIFLDVGRPIINGYEICSQIKKVSKLKHIPVVILTGNDGTLERLKAEIVGANAFVTKPLEIEKIQQVIVENLSFNL